MRFKLYEVEIERVSGWSQYHIVAESKERAGDLAIDYEFVLQHEHIRFSLKRVWQNSRRDGIGRTRASHRASSARLG
jgi:hypothetical protein